MGSQSVGPRKELARCSAHGLTFDPATADGCVLCRRASSSPGTGRWRALVWFVAGIVVLGGIVVAARASLFVEPASTTTVATLPPIDNDNSVASAAPAPANANRLPPLELQLSATNGSGRRGYLFAPARARDETLQLMVALHGQGGDGRELIAVLRPLAEQHRFAIVAPSSNYAGPLHDYTWTVGDHPNDVTVDYRHVAACVTEALGRTDLNVDSAHALIAGYSGGGSSAPYIASNTAPYAAFAVLHGGVFIGGIGPRKVPGWFSAGESDPIRPPGGVFANAQSMIRAGFDVTYRTYPGTHVVSSRELTDVVNWWLALR